MSKRNSSRPGTKAKRKRNPPTRKTLNVYQLGAERPKRQLIEPTNKQLGIVYNLAEQIGTEYRKRFHDQPHTVQARLQKSLLGLIEDRTRARTLIDQIDGEVGAHFANLADNMVESDARSSLANLLHELEVAVGVVNDLIDEHGESALLAQMITEEP